MGEEDWDKGRLIRVPESLWIEFGEAVDDNDRDRSTVLRSYMRRYVAAWKGRKGKPGHDDTPSAGASPS